MKQEKYCITTQYGFLYGCTDKGAALVTRSHSDDCYGTYIAIETKSQAMTIRITPGGKIIPFDVAKKKKKGFIQLSHQDRVELEAQ